MRPCNTKRKNPQWNPIQSNQYVLNTLSENSIFQLCHSFKKLRRKVSLIPSGIKCNDLILYEKLGADPHTVPVINFSVPWLKYWRKLGIFHRHCHHLLHLLWLNIYLWMIWISWLFSLQFLLPRRLPFQVAWCFLQWAKYIKIHVHILRHMYTSTYMYTHASIHTHTYICAYIHIYTYMHAYIHTCTYITINVQVWTKSVKHETPKRLLIITTLQTILPFIVNCVSCNLTRSL